MNTLKFERLNLLKSGSNSYQQYYCLPVNPRTKDIVDSLEFNGTYIPGISRIITSHAPERVVKDNNGKVVRTKPEVYSTILEWEDGTRTAVKCSDIDTPDTELAIVNAIVKRAYGSLDEKNNTKADGCSVWLKKLVNSVWDQQKEEARIKAEKSAAKSKHQARQNAEHEKALQRKTQKVADQISTIVEVLKALGLDIAVDVQKTTPSNKKILNEETSANKCTCTKTKDDTCKNECPKSSEYVRPNKKFSEFTTEEKREYWRNQKSKNK